MVTWLLKILPANWPSSNGQTVDALAILVRYIKCEQYLNVSQNNNRINVTVWFWICVVKKWQFSLNKIHTLFTVQIVVRCGQKTHLKDVALILIDFLNLIECLWAKYKSVDSCGASDVQTWLLYMPPFPVRNFVAVQSRVMFNWYSLSIVLFVCSVVLQCLLADYQPSQSCFSTTARFAILSLT